MIHASKVDGARVAPQTFFVVMVVIIQWRRLCKDEKREKRYTIMSTIIETRKVIKSNIKKSFLLSNIAHVIDERSSEIIGLVQDEVFVGI